MNSIVRSNYPAARLPEDLRKGLDPTSTVTVMVTVEGQCPPNVLSLDQLYASRRPPYRSQDEIDAEIRRQRDEWDG